MFSGTQVLLLHDLVWQGPGSGQVRASPPQHCRHTPLQQTSPLGQQAPLQHTASGGHEKSGLVPSATLIGTQVFAWQTLVLQANGGQACASAPQHARHAPSQQKWSPGQRSPGSPPLAMVWTTHVLLLHTLTLQMPGSGQLLASAPQHALHAPLQQT